MRGDAARRAPGWRRFLEEQTRGDDNLKRNVARVRQSAWPSVSVAEKLVAEAADRMLRESAQPMSEPSRDSLYWGCRGSRMA